MQLGMIGLGRMGANLTRRLMRDGHEMVVWNRDPAPTAKLASEGAIGSETPADLVAKLEAAGGLDHGARGRDRPGRERRGQAPRRGRHDHRRRQLVLPRRHRPRRRAGGEGDPLRRRRHLGRRLRARARLLPDDRRRGRGRRPARSDLRHHCTRCRRGPAHARADRRRRHLRARAICTAARTAPGTSSRWCTTGSSTASWPRTPRASTSSRTPTPGCASAPATPRRRRSTIPSSTATPSTPPRSPRCGGAAASSARGCST